MSYARRTDANHTPILDVFRSAGWWVLDLHRQGGGCGDAIVGRLVNQWSPQVMDLGTDDGGFRGYLCVYMIEIKNRAGRNRVGKNQKDFAARCPLPYRIVRTIDEALALVGGR